jgi:hypothetical protein
MTNRRTQRRALIFAFVLLFVAANGALLLLRNSQLRDSFDGTSGDSAAMQPLLMRTQLLTAIAAESLSESIARLADFDDSVWALGGPESDTVSPPCSYRSHFRYVPRLTRVRRIIEEGINDDDSLRVRLEKLLGDAADGFSAVEEAKHREIATSRNGVILESPDSYWRKSVEGPVAVYLLAELGCTKSLPFLLRLYDSGERLPVSRLFLLYAMHLLVQEHDSLRLSPHARELHQAYEQIASDFPPPETRQVACWKSAVDDDDFRAGILRRDVVHEPGCTATLRLYPESLCQWEDHEGLSTVNVSQYINALRAFVEEAYPGEVLAN